ncbi:MAG: TonB-dependent receptor [Rhodoferax sp.]|uniref:TonB-dependent receptor plug domain-containing protein n=1 Tax=Rhodoferax sp. TaxID=50421 RepID=UPI0013FFA4F6|nr:TonB-dependent receptor [Rhodoferax sp.]NDP39302.1 TonB-dependent receptor [Rhodoferax sp.]
MRNKPLRFALRPWGAALVLFASVNLAIAQAPDPHQAAATHASALSEADFLAEMPIVLSVSRLPQRLDETRGAVTIIDRDMIRLSGARDVADLLRLVPGFQTSTSFETGAPLASYHGGFDSYSNRIQVLIDGRSVYSPYFIGSVGPGLQTVALADIERIEVLRGSNSAAYGARALLGVINIVTRHTLDTLGLQATLGAGENGVRDGQARIGWGQPDASYRLTVDRRSDDGLAGSNGHNQVDRANLRADVRSGAGDEIGLRAGGLVIEFGKGIAGKIDNALRDAAFKSGYAQVDWRRVLNADEDLAFAYSHSQETYDDSFMYVGPVINSSGRPVLGQALFDASGRSSSDAVSLQHTVRLNSNLRVVWGGEFRHEEVASQGLYNTDSTFVTEFSRLFGNAEWRAARDLIVNAGLMLEHSSVSGDGVSPRLMLNWHVADAQTLRVGVSKALRPPSTFESFSDVRYVSTEGVPQAVSILASGRARPEGLLVRELGYLGAFPKLALDLDVRLFHEQFDGFLRQKNDTRPADYVNGENLSIQGLEYQLKWRAWQGAQLIFNQAFTSINSANEGATLAAPNRASSLTFFQKFPSGLDLSLMHQDTSEFKPHSGGTDSKRTISRTDLRLGVPLRFGSNRGELALVVQNMGSPYTDQRKTFSFERRAFVTLQLEN